MSVRAWARSRGIPASTAARAVRDGRLLLGPDGRIPDAREADRQWTARTRLRVDSRIPRPPQESELTPEEEAAINQALADAHRGPAWNGDEGDQLVSMRVVDAYEVQMELLRERAQQDLVKDRGLAVALLQCETEGQVQGILERMFARIRATVTAGQARLEGGAPLFEAGLRPPQA